jgi:hypothetical protein
MILGLLLLQYYLNTFQKKIAVSKTNEFLEFFAVVFGEFIDVLLVIT